MFKACSRCGKMHPANEKCPIGREYRGGQERELRKKYAWQKRSMQIRQDAQGLCEVCKDRGTYTYKGLEVHHIEKLKDKPELLLDGDNLICLCSNHHKMADSGELSKEYLRNLALKREGKQSPHTQRE